MSVFNENDRDKLLITIYYHSVPVISFILNTTGISFTEPDEINGTEIFF
jgi:hypothetical protein